MSKNELQRIAVDVVVCDLNNSIQATALTICHVVVQFKVGVKMV